MMRAIGPVNVTDPMVCYVCDEPYADPRGIQFASVSRPGRSPSAPVALATTVSTANGEIGDDYSLEVFSLDSRFCLVVSALHREFDIAHLENLKYEFRLDDDWTHADSWCYICHRTRHGKRTIACDHCGRSACVSHFSLPFVRSDQHGMQVVEIRCARCAQMASTCDMVVCDYEVQSNLRLNTSLLKLSPLYAHPEHQGVSNNGLFLVKQIEDELAGSVDRLYGPVDKCIKEVVAMLKQSRIYHHTRSKEVVDIKLANVARTQDGTWKIIDLGSITDFYATELSATYHFIMCKATCRALGITRGDMLHFDDSMTVRVRALANELLAETAYLVMLSTLLFGESNLGRLDHGVQEFDSCEGFILHEHHETMAGRAELSEGGALFETGQLYLETLSNVLTQMHFIFHSQQHMIAAQKVRIMKDSMPPAADFYRIESVVSHKRRKTNLIESDDDTLAEELERELASQVNEI